MPVWVDRDGWVRCPVCGGKTRTKVRDDTVLKHFPLYCPKCRRTSLIDTPEKNIPDSEPDA